MPQIFVLMLYLYVPAMNAGGAVTMQEFSSLERCEHAATVAKKKFAGAASPVYSACVPK